MRTRNRDFNRRRHFYRSRIGTPQSVKAELERPDNLSEISDENYSHGYHNPDNSRNNYWLENVDEEDHGIDEFEPTGYIESEHFEPEHPFHAVGFGNENSHYVEDFNRMKQNSENWYRRGEELQMESREERERHNESIRPPHLYHDHDFYHEEDIDDDFPREFQRIRRPNIRDRWSY